MKPGRSWFSRAQAIGDPCAHRRPARPRRTGEDQQLGRGVVELVGDHRVHHAQLVGHFGQLRHRVGKPDARLAMLLERPPRAQELGRAGSEGEALALECRRRGRAGRRASPVPACSRTDRGSAASRSGGYRSSAWPWRRSAVSWGPRDCPKPQPPGCRASEEAMAMAPKASDDWPRNCRRVIVCRSSSRGSIQGLINNSSRFSNTLPTAVQAASCTASPPAGSGPSGSQASFRASSGCLA